MAKVIGVSPDSVLKHAKFKAKHGFTYPLIADTEHIVSDLYGVWAQKSMFGKKYWGVNRTTFVIDAAGRIVHVFPKVKLLGHAEEVASMLTSLAR